MANESATKPTYEELEASAADWRRKFEEFQGGDVCKMNYDLGALCEREYKRAEKAEKECSAWQQAFDNAVADLERARGLLQRYGRHEDGCEYREALCSQPTCGEMHITPCTCGLGAESVQPEKLNNAQKCPDCSGRGHVTAHKPMGGFGSQPVECWTCKGNGALAESSLSSPPPICSRCHSELNADGTCDICELNRIRKDATLTSPEMSPTQLPKEK